MVGSVENGLMVEWNIEWNMEWTIEFTLFIAIASSNLYCRGQRSLAYSTVSSS